MEGNTWPAVAITSLAPIAWGSTYAVTAAFLPPDRPLFAAMSRALPAGILLLAITRQLPRGEWWWRSAILGVLNIGAFFPLIFLAAYRIPGGLAATLTAVSPLVVMALAWPLIGERPQRLQVLGGVVGIAGVAALVLRPGIRVDFLGVAASLGAVAISAVGFILVKKWQPPVSLLTFTSWQLMAGGLFLVPVALLVEGAPPRLDLPAVGGLVYLSTFGTAIAYLAWFHGLRSMPAGATALVGLINPVVGTLLGVAFMHEVFGPVQALGMALVLGGVVAGQPAVTQFVRRRARSPQPDTPGHGKLGLGTGCNPCPGPVSPVSR